MLVKLLIDISGTRDGQDWPGKGSTVDLPEQTAQDMILAGQAQAVEVPVEAARVETEPVRPEPSKPEPVKDSEPSTPKRTIKSARGRKVSK